MYYLYNQLHTQVFCMYIYISKALKMYTVIPIQSFVKYKKKQYKKFRLAVFLRVGMLLSCCKF